MDVDHPWFDHDNRQIACLALDALHSRGRRAPLIVSPPMTQNYAQQFWQGAVETADRHGMAVERLAGADNDSPSDHLATTLETVLATGRFDAVVTLSIRAAIAAVEVIERLGLDLGVDIDLAGKEPVPFLKSFRRQIIAIHEDAAEAGTFLARAALRALSNPEAPPMQHLCVPTEDSVSL